MKTNIRLMIIILGTLLPLWLAAAPDGQPAAKPDTDERASNVLTATNSLHQSPSVTTNTAWGRPAPPPLVWVETNCAPTKPVRPSNFRIVANR